MKILNKSFNAELKEQTDDFLMMLTQRAGLYSGMGTNHEEKQFRGMFDLQGLIGGRGARIHYTAIGVNGTDFNRSTNLYSIETIVYNEEETLVAYDGSNKLCLWSLNSNLGTLVRFEFRHHKYIKDDRNVFIFGYGDRKDNKIFREEITIELYENGEIGYNYAWGEPNGLLLNRSNIVMKRIS